MMKFPNVFRFWLPKWLTSSCWPSYVLLEMIALLAAVGTSKLNLKTGTFSLWILASLKLRCYTWWRVTMPKHISIYFAPCFQQVLSSATSPLLVRLHFTMLLKCHFFSTATTITLVSSDLVLWINQSTSKSNLHDGDITPNCHHFLWWS